VVHCFILHNGQIRDSREKLLSPGQVGLMNGWGVFSTIRVADGVLFAFERHWARMSKDAALLHVPFPKQPEETRAALLRLVEANGAPDCTLRVVVVRNRGGAFGGPVETDADLIAFTASLKDWGRGVKLAYVEQGRHAGSRFAGAKILSWSMNLTFLEEAQSAGFDEVVLLNERGEVAECTSANIFIARDRQVFTPPLSSGCLPGVTRELLLGEIRVSGYEISEQTLYPRDLETAPEVFITSTTRDLLPVERIGDYRIPNSGTARAALQAAFSRYVEQYIAARKGIPV